VHGPSTPDRILETVAPAPPTLFFSVPALYAAMLKRRRSRRRTSPACAPASRRPSRCPPRLGALAGATGVPILDGIGSTEMLHIYCSNTLEDLRPGTSGTPVPGYELRWSTSRARTRGRRSRRPARAR
jgi:benzoate-CoA ligase